MKFIISGLVLLVGVLTVTTISSAKVEYTKKEKKACVTCHVSAKSKELNATGQYYKDHNHSLEGFKPKDEKK